jgi:D-alanine-D-alanine ligase
MRDPGRDPLLGVHYPAIVKPACMDASHGIEPSNVVDDEPAARAKAAYLLERFPPAVLVEQFLDGREINVSVVQLDPTTPPTVLPLAEVDWQLPPGVPRVCGYAAKWVEGTEFFLKTPIVCPAVVSEDLGRRISEVALAAFEAVSGRDYLRVDIRIDHAGQPYVLEVNPNPCIAPISGLVRSAEAAGWSYPELIQTFVRVAENRGPLAPFAKTG